MELLVRHTKYPYPSLHGIQQNIGIAILNYIGIPRTSTKFSRELRGIMESPYYIRYPYVALNIPTWELGGGGPCNAMQCNLVEYSAIPVFCWIFLEARIYAMPCNAIPWNIPWSSIFDVANQISAGSIEFHGTRRAFSNVTRVPWNSMVHSTGRSPFKMTSMF